MTSSKNNTQENAVNDELAADFENAGKSVHMDPEILPEEIPSTLYNDVEIDASHSEQSEPLDFTVEETTNETLEHFSFTADTAPHINDNSAHVTINADVKVEGMRQEPVMLDKAGLNHDAVFAAIDSDVHNVENEVEATAEAATPASPIKPTKGSKLGMGWFQGFNLFICGVIFIGLAIFAYFMFGEAPLYSGKIPKYVVVETEDSASMGVLNPAIPLEEREQYIYVPKVERADDLELPVLDDADTVKSVTKVELLSDGSIESAVTEIDEEKMHTDASDQDELAENDAPAFELLSSDHNQKGLSEEDMEMVNLFNQQAGYAFMQGNYVGVNFNDAYYYYQEALKLDPESVPALNGLIAIADIYYKSAADTYQQGNADIAAQYLAIGLKVLPDYAPLLQLKAEMERNPIQSQQNAFPSSTTDGFQFE